MGASNDSTQPRSSFKDARVRDRRRASWFSVDNEVLDDFGPLIGLHGFAVYCALSRHAYAGDEEANVSLTKLCTHLKMGRAKLLETLGELRDVGLIAIERGDRKTTNTYTLLEVPKGSSEENQGSSEENQGSSEENQGSSEENQGGGSEENPYKTRENKTIKKVFSAKNHDSGRQRESERRVEQIRTVFGPDAV
jgi:hypothetical protein